MNRGRFLQTRVLAPLLASTVRWAWANDQPGERWTVEPGTEGAMQVTLYKPIDGVEYMLRAEVLASYQHLYGWRWLEHVKVVIHWTWQIEEARIRSERRALARSG